MNERHTFALTHPITDPDIDRPEPYRALEPQPDGNHLLSMLAVDR